MRKDKDLLICLAICVIALLGSFLTLYLHLSKDNDPFHSLFNIGLACIGLYFLIFKFKMFSKP